jgi:hypothetical protein
MIREGQFTTEIRDYLNSLPPWKDSAPANGWLVGMFYDNLYELRREAYDTVFNKEYDNALHKFYQLWCFYDYEMRDHLTLDDVKIFGTVITELYEYWNTHGHSRIPLEIVNKYIMNHEFELMSNSDYIELDDIVL